MKGYYTSSGFYGFVDGDYCYYACEFDSYASDMFDDQWD